MSPALRRRILISTRRSAGDAGEARAVVEDDFHHFRVSVRHADGVIISARGAALRQPYITCALAGGELAKLEAQRLSSASYAVYAMTEPRLQCTHMLELSGLAIAAAARGIVRRQYDITIPDRVNGITSPSLSKDGAPLLHWQADLQTLLAPVAFAGIGYRQGFAHWVRAHLDEDTAEAALALRRALIISVGRTKDLEAQLHAEPRGNCYSQQPERAPRATRVRGSIKDFPDHAALCAADSKWIAFEDDTAAASIMT